MVPSGLLFLGWVETTTHRKEVSRIYERRHGEKRTWVMTSWFWLVKSLCLKILIMISICFHMIGWGFTIFSPRHTIYTYNIYIYRFLADKTFVRPWFWVSSTCSLQQIPLVSTSPPRRPPISGAAYEMMAEAVRIGWFGCFVRWWWWK